MRRFGGFACRTGGSSSLCVGAGLRRRCPCVTRAPSAVRRCVQTKSWRVLLCRVRARPCVRVRKQRTTGREKGRKACGRPHLLGGLGCSASKVAPTDMTVHYDPQEMQISFLFRFADSPRKLASQCQFRRAIRGLSSLWACTLRTTGPSRGSRWRRRLSRRTRDGRRRVPLADPDAAQICASASTLTG